MSQQHYGGTLVAPATAASLRTMLITAGVITAARFPVPGPAYRTLIIRLKSGTGPIYFGVPNGYDPVSGAATTALTNTGTASSGNIDATVPIYTINLQSPGMAFTDHYFVAGNGTETLQVDIHE